MPHPRGVARTPPRSRLRWSREGLLGVVVGCRRSASPAAAAAAVLVCMVAGSFVDPHGENGPTWGARTPNALSLTLMTLGAAALVFRRRAPMAVLAATSAVSLVELVTGDPRAPVAMSAVVALYTVAPTTDRPTTWPLGLLTMTVPTASATLAGPLP